MATKDPTNVDGRDIYTPARLNREARVLLERGLPSLWIEGELSNFSRPSSGHWYFSLKDADAQLRCAMFRQRNLLTQFSPKDGAHVLLRGRVSLYEPRGDYQFIADHMEEAGEGALRRQFELLKSKLAALGLFAPEHKKTLPALPKRIGVVTSPTGAAVRDILHILRRRFSAIPVRIYPVPVQGAQAAGQIAAAIALANRREDCDVLILARGGGSLEDLWAFNEEIVARAIFESRIPIVTGVGHEVDFTIADFVADVRAPTPSGAAELVAPDGATWLNSLSTIERRLALLIRKSFESQREQFEWLQRRLVQLHPGVQLRQQSQRIDELEQRLTRAMNRRLLDRQSDVRAFSARLQSRSPLDRVRRLGTDIELAQNRLGAAVRRRIEYLRTKVQAAARTLDAVSPLGTLSRGYSIVTSADHRVITDANAVRPGDTVHAQLARGAITARIESIESKD